MDPLAFLFKLLYVIILQVTKCRSKLFAQRLFEAIDVDNSGDISFKELLNAVYTLRSRDKETRINFIFELFDLDHDEFISDKELELVLDASIVESDVTIMVEEKKILISALKSLFHIEDYDKISRSNFHLILTQYPDITEGLSLEGMHLLSNSGSKDIKIYNTNILLKWIINNRQKLITYTVTILTILGCFSWRFQFYIYDCGENTKNLSFSQNEKIEIIYCKNFHLRKLMGWSLAIAKATGQAMKVIFSIILLPISKHLMTQLRGTFLKMFFCFDNVIEYHKFLGKIGFFLAWAHTLCHICNMYRCSDPKRLKEWDIVFNNDEESLVQPSMNDLSLRWISISGYILICIYTIAALFSFDYPKKLFLFQKNRKQQQNVCSGMVNYLGILLNNFNSFWYTHQLLGIFYICLLFHPIPNIPQVSNQWTGDIWLWITVPITLYSIEWIKKNIQSNIRDTSILSVNLLPGNVLGMRLSKPKGVSYIAGQYIYLNCPGLSIFEWHPFTLTSSPGDSFLEVHIRENGDWTRALLSKIRKFLKQSNGTHEVSENLLLDTNKAYTSLLMKSVSGSIEEVIPTFPFKICIDGPFGAPAQNYKDYKIIILVGAGIGVTPFASVLSDMLNTMKQHHCSQCGHINLPKTIITRKVYFFWTVRFRHEVAWFKSILESISDEDQNGLIEINIHITSIRHAEDVRVMLLRLAQKRNNELIGVDLLSTIQTRTITHFGRPNWRNAFLKIKDAHPEEKHFGVFYCGPNELGSILKNECRKYENNDVKFDFKKEIF